MWVRKVSFLWLLKGGTTLSPGGRGRIIGFPPTTLVAAPKGIGGSARAPPFTHTREACEIVRQSAFSPSVANGFLAMTISAGQKFSHWWIVESCPKCLPRTLWGWVWQKMTTGTWSNDLWKMEPDGQVRADGWKV